MASKSELLSGMVRLKDILDKLNPEQKELELFTYGLLSSSRLDFVSNLDTELDTKIEKLINTPPEDYDSITNLNTKSEFYSWLSRFGHAPAYIICLNFDPETEHESHRFRGEHNHGFKNKHFSSKDIRMSLIELGFKDGAILIKPDGILYTVKSQFTNIDPKEIILSKGDENLDPNNPSNYGFKEPVNVRHFSAIGTSYHLKGTVIYTLSEETGNIRRYQDGKITFSTLQDEDPFPNHHISNLL